MWINPMLTIWLYGTIFSLLLIVFTLWLWYWREPSETSLQQHDGGPHDASGSAARRASTQPGGDDAAQ